MADSTIPLFEGHQFSDAENQDFPDFIGYSDFSDSETESYSDDDDVCVADDCLEDCVTNTFNESPPVETNEPQKKADTSSQSPMLAESLKTKFEDVQHISRYVRIFFCKIKTVEYKLNYLFSTKNLEMAQRMCHEICWKS